MIRVAQGEEGMKWLLVIHSEDCPYRTWSEEYQEWWCISGVECTPKACDTRITDN